MKVAAALAGNNSVQFISGNNSRRKAGWWCGT